jgi:acyl-CoA thioesterase I
MIRWQPFVGLAFAGLMPAVAYARSPTNVACLGDSITVGVGASSVDKEYPSVLQVTMGTGVDVQNFGVSGATMLTNGDKPYTKEYRYMQAVQYVMALPADAVVDVVIMLGTNDSKPYNWTPDGGVMQDKEYIADYEAMIRTLAGMPSKPAIYVVLPPATGPTPCCDINGTVIHDQILPAIKTVAADYNLAVIDAYTPFVGHSELITYDNVHPNDDGNAVLAQTIYNGLGAPLPVEAVPDASASAGGSSVAGGGAVAGGASAGGASAGGAGGKPGTGGTGLTAAGGDAAKPSSSSSSGCGCSVAGTPSRGAWFAFGIGALAVARLRRRRSSGLPV